MNSPRPHHRTGSRIRILAKPALVPVLVALLLLGSLADRALGQELQEVVPGEDVIVAVLPFQVHVSRTYGDVGRSLADRLIARLGSMGGLEVVASARTREFVDALEPDHEPTDLELRRLAAQLPADAIITGSVTELAGRFSLDVRVTPADSANRSHTLVFTADGEEELLARLEDAGDRIGSGITRGIPTQIVRIDIEGAGPLTDTLRKVMEVQAGDDFDPGLIEVDRLRLEEHPEVASATVDTKRIGDGVVVEIRVLPAMLLFAREPTAEGDVPVVEIQVRGNRRIEAGAVLSRVGSQIGEPLRPAQLASDVRDIFGAGYFRDIRVFVEEVPEGVILIFEVEENPVVRQISLSGNDKVDEDKIREVLTLTTGATLDYPLLTENVERIEVLYRAEGYYLADVGYEIEEITDGSIAIHFEVDEKEKLKLRKISFEGNEEFSDKALREDFAIKTWKFYSPLTSWFDKSGTYSEPIFMRDLQSVERAYSDAGYLQVEVRSPRVEATEEGLFVIVDVVEGPQFRVGAIDVAGDDTMQLDVLRGKLLLAEGDVFNRSFLTADVEALEQHYTDRGFYFASVQPQTRMDRENMIVDVQFGVEKGPLYFIRHVNIAGNTRTVDRVIRREMNVVEGQLYSARALQVSTMRVQGLGFFEDVSFEPQTTDDPSQLDLEVSVVERPTGSFSFGAGYSSQDKFVFTASLAQANLFGRGYGVNLSADVGGRTTRFFFSFSDPSFWDSDFSLGATIFYTEVNFQDFKQLQQGIDFSLGHSLSEDNTSRGFMRYSFAKRKITQDTRVNASAPIFREILQGVESSSMLGISLRRDTRDDRFTPTHGVNTQLSLDYAGLGGFANFFRIEARHAWYMGAPRWLFKRSTFVVGARLGYTFPFNSILDYDLGLNNVPGCRVPGQCIDVANLDQISRDLTLPLSERYFLGGIGTFQLRGYKARSVGPRRAILKRSGTFGGGDLFSPVGTEVRQDTVTGKLIAECNDTTPLNQGNLNGRCNKLSDTQISDFDDLRETDVVGGSKFFTTTVEYRFPISEEVGLQGIVFVDMGGSFAEEDNLFDPGLWRYGYGGGVLWFSPFGPLQLVLGFPVDPHSFEKSPVFEFSVGGFGL